MVGSRGFLPRSAQERTTSSSSSWRAVVQAWREPRTLAIGLVAMSFALIEGIANDWLAIGLIDGYEVADHVGTIGFAAFVTAMTIGRMLGTALIDRFGRVSVLLVTATLVAAGTLVVVFGGSITAAMVGVLIWGLGASLGFPLAMSAAADDTEESARSAARVSVVASVGYTAFLAGPPVLGYLGDHQGVLRALLVVVGAAALGALAAPATTSIRRTPPGDESGPDSDSRSGSGPGQDDPGRTSPIS